MSLSLGFPRILHCFLLYAVKINLNVMINDSCSLAHHKQLEEENLLKESNFDSEHYFYFFEQFFYIGAIHDRVDTRTRTVEQDQNQ